MLENEKNLRQSSQDVIVDLRNQVQNRCHLKMRLLTLELLPVPLFGSDLDRVEIQNRCYFLCLNLITLDLRNNSLL